MTEIRADGEVGRDAAEVLRRLLGHAITATGLQIQETPPGQEPERGQYQIPGITDPTAPPGVARLYLSSEQEVVRVFHALDCQTIQVGGDLVGITVLNDGILARQVPGGGRRSR